MIHKTLYLSVFFLCNILFSSCFNFKNRTNAIDPQFANGPRKPTPKGQNKPENNVENNNQEANPEASFPPLLHPEKPPPPPESSVSRSSGMVTQLRLQALFPNSLLIIPKSDFAFEGAKGLNRAFGLQARPSDSLAQIALRQKVVQLCSDSSLLDNSSLFRLVPGEQTLPDESIPSSTEERRVFAAIRNAWIHPYKPADAEFQELLKLYKAASNLSSLSDPTAADKALCMAVLLAPQFWLGAPEGTDPARRVSMELFRRVPSLKEVKDYADGKVSMEEYFTKLLADPKGEIGFKETLSQWHEEWLGFREFFAAPGASVAFYEDRRGDLTDRITGLSNIEAHPFSFDSQAGTQIQAIKPIRIAGTPAGKCRSSSQQDFDPDTAMISWEHFNFRTQKFEFVGGFIRTGPAGTFSFADTDTNTKTMSKTDVLSFLTSLSPPFIGEILPMPTGNPSPVANTILAIRQAMVQYSCNKATSEGYNLNDQEGYNWKRCNGLLTINSLDGTHLGETLTETIKRIEDSNLAASDPETYHPECASQANPTQCRAEKKATDLKNRLDYAKDLLQTVLRVVSFNTSSYFHSELGIFLKTLNDQTKVTGPFLDELFVEQNNLQQIKDKVSLLIQAVSAGNWYFETNIAEMKNPLENNGGGLTYNLGRFERFSHKLGANVKNHKLPIYSPATLGFEPHDRRVRRLGGIQNQWQDGYSIASLWFTGSEIAVCNNTDRFWASCFFRPTTAVGEKDFTGFNPAEGKIWSAFYKWNSDSYMHPLVSSSFYCALPEQSLLSQYDSVKTKQAFHSLKINSQTYMASVNPVASHIDLQNENSNLISISTSVGRELAVFKDLYHQMREEPYRLISHLVLNNEDYRTMLTADYTFGNGCLQFFYNTQGFYLPFHPQSSGILCQRPGQSDFMFSAGDPIPTGQLANSHGGFQGATNPRNLLWKSIFGYNPDFIPARLYSGILTMPAFISPVASKARGIASRFFARLLCDQPNFYDPALDPGGSKLALHESFISSRPHLRQECFTCHRNLDPVASAFSWSYLGLLIPNPNKPSEFLGGENSPGDYHGEIDYYLAKQLPLAGVRHGTAPKGQGAFLGQSVDGIRDLGDKISKSHRFAQCAVETTFLNIFGRNVQLADLKIVREFIEGFKDPTKNNYRYLELIKTMITSDHYKRKN